VKSKGYKPKEWLRDVKPGQLLEVLQRATLFPQTMWDSSSDADYQQAMPMLKAKDKIVVLEVLDDTNDSININTFSALVITPYGVGCVLLFEQSFKIISLD
jgi:hypothetical protein